MVQTTHAPQIPNNPNCARVELSSYDILEEWCPYTVGVHFTHIKELTHNPVTEAFHTPLKYYYTRVNNTEWHFQYRCFQYMLRDVNLAIFIISPACYQSIIV